MIDYLSHEYFLSTSLNLKLSMENFLYGSPTQPPRGAWVVAQKVVRDADGQPVKSDYVYKVTGEGKHKDRGPATTRLGYLCNEVFMRIFMSPATRQVKDEIQTPMGAFTPQRMVLYTAASEPLNIHDVIIDVQLDPYGNPSSPITPITEWIVILPVPKRLDLGRLEFNSYLIEVQK